MNAFWQVSRIEHGLLLAWTTFAGLIVFALFVSFDQGLVQLMFASDRSRISVLIGILFVIGVGHALWRVLYVSRELVAVDAIRGRLQAEPTAVLTLTGGRLGTGSAGALPDGFACAYLSDVLRGRNAIHVDAEDHGASGNLPEIYAGLAKGPQDIGWFLTDAILKLGLLGTIVGFILMLGSVADTASLDANTMQKVLRQMSVGMGTALYTTLAGLVCSLILGVQYQLIERGADALLEQTMHLAEVDVLPRLAAPGARA